MKKLIALILSFVYILGLVGCSKDATYQSTEITNISIRIFNISPTGATIIIKDSNEIPHTYGAWYQIEKNANGEWHEIETVIDNYGFALVGYLPDHNGEIEFTMDWEWLYGKLPTGQYRLIKQVDNQYISIEFDTV